MAGRNIKIGLSYFPMDVDFFSDIKIRKLIKYKSANVITIYINLLCLIYKDGYYIKWDLDMPFIIAETTGYDEEYIAEVLLYCINIGLFSKELYEHHNIITSKGIQERYKMICDLRKGKATINEFSLINSEEILITSEEIVINSELMQQSKVNKIEVNKIKGNADFISSLNLLLVDDLWHIQIMESDSRLTTKLRTIEFIKKFLNKQKASGYFPAEVNKTKAFFMNWIAKQEIECSVERLSYAYPTAK